MEDYEREQYWRNAGEAAIRNEMDRRVALAWARKHPEMVLRGDRLRRYLHRRHLREKAAL